MGIDNRWLQHNLIPQISYVCILCGSRIIHVVEGIYIDIWIWFELFENIIYCYRILQLLESVHQPIFGGYTGKVSSFVCTVFIHFYDWFTYLQLLEYNHQPPESEEYRDQVRSLISTVWKYCIQFKEVCLANPHVYMYLSETSLESYFNTIWSYSLTNFMD